MKFSPDKPTLPGWYWVKYKSEYNTIPFIVIAKVTRSYYKNPVDTIRLWDLSYTLNDSRFLAFAGPIPEPEPES